MSHAVLHGKDEVTVNARLTLSRKLHAETNVIFECFK